MATERSQKSKALQNAAKDFVMLAHTFKPEKHITEDPTLKKHVDIRDWYMFEKLDGVRARLKNGKIWSRSGKMFHAPSEWLDNMSTACSDQPVDGELTHTSENFNAVISAVRNHNASMDDWKNVCFTAFDLVDPVLSFEERYKRLNIMHVLEHFSVLKDLGRVCTQEKLHTKLNLIMAEGGEGIILRNPEATYEFGRSWNLLKVKQFKDVEALVVDYYPGEGKHEGRIGGLVCQLDNGLDFRVGTGFSDEDRKNPPPIGAKVTIKYFEETDKGRPRFPVFIANRDYE